MVVYSDTRRITTEIFEKAKSLEALLLSCDFSVHAVSLIREVEHEKEQQVREGREEEHVEEVEGEGGTLAISPSHALSSTISWWTFNNSMHFSEHLAIV